LRFLVHELVWCTSLSNTLTWIISKCTRQVSAPLHGAAKNNLPYSYSIKRYIMSSRRKVSVYEKQYIEPFWSPRTHETVDYCVSASALPTTNSSSQFLDVQDMISETCSSRHPPDSLKGKTGYYSIQLLAPSYTCH
jgi:hypothetical protein